MTESTDTNPAKPLDAPPTTGHAVYDEAELRFVTGPLDEADAKADASDRNKGNKVKRADGKSGQRYTVRPV